MRILVLAHEAGSVLTSIRLREPLSELCQRLGWTLKLQDLRNCQRRDLANFDVLVVQRGACRHTAALMRHMTRLGGQVVYEIDDLLLQPAQHLRDHDHLRASSQRVRTSLALADVVTTTTERLASALRPLARRVELAPNFAPPAAPRAQPWRAGHGLTLVLASSDRMAPGLLPAAVLQAQALRPGQIRVLCVGLAHAVFEGSAVQYRSLPMLSRSAFWQFLANEPNAVLAVPLDASPFSACKSAAKFFDCAAVGVPVLCADRPPYADVVVDGLTGTLVADSVQAWTDALLAAVDDPQTLQARAQLARADVARRFNMDRTMDAWQRLLQSLPTRSQRRSWLDAAWAGGLALMHQRMDDLRLANHARVARRRLARQATAAAPGSASAPASRS
jgi:hypothetical protein